MTITYHSGSDGRAFVTPTAGSGPTQSELAVTGWDLEIDSDIKKFDNNANGRWRQGGNVDASGNLKMHWDSSNRPTDVESVGIKPNMRNGTIMDVQLAEDGTSTATHSWRLRIILDKIKQSSEFDGTIDFECSYMLQSGTIKYPGDA